MGCFVWWVCVVFGGVALGGGRVAVGAGVAGRRPPEIFRPWGMHAWAGRGQAVPKPCPSSTALYIYIYIYIMGAHAAHRSNHVSGLADPRAAVFVKVLVWLSFTNDRVIHQ